MRRTRFSKHANNNSKKPAKLRHNLFYSNPRLLPLAAHWSHPAVARTTMTAEADLATDGVIGANGGPRSPGTAYILLHHCMGGVGGKRGLWGFVRGGMGAVTRAMADSARGRGATIRTNAAVERILVGSGRARGVVLQ